MRTSHLKVPVLVPTSAGYQLAPRNSTGGINSSDMSVTMKVTNHIVVINAQHRSTWSIT